MELGATGDYPDGKLGDDDEGEVKIAITTDTDKQVVIIDFGTPVTWMGLPKEHALALGNTLIEHANDLD